MSGRVYIPGGRRADLARLLHHLRGADPVEVGALLGLSHDPPDVSPLQEDPPLTQSSATPAAPPPPLPRGTCQAPRNLTPYAP